MAYDPVRVIAYDTNSDARRRKLSSLLEDNAVRVQYSVFEARMNDKRLKSMVAEIKNIITAEDKIRIYTLDQNSLARSYSFGGSPLPERQDFWLL